MDHKAVLLGALASMGRGKDALINLLSSDSGITSVKAKRNRSPNKSNRRTYDFVRREGSGIAVFRCRQTRLECVMPLTIRNSSHNAMEFYS